MFYIYILYSVSADKYYVGHSNDPDKRRVKHNTTDFVTFTKKWRPWKLVYSFPVSPDRGDTLKIERFIKKQKSRKLILRIINDKLGFEDFSWILK